MHKHVSLLTTSFHVDTQQRQRGAKKHFYGETRGQTLAPHTTHNNNNAHLSKKASPSTTKFPPTPVSSQTTGLFVVQRQFVRIQTKRLRILIPLGDAVHPQPVVGPDRAQSLLPGLFDFPGHNCFWVGIRATCK